MRLRYTYSAARQLNRALGHIAAHSPRGAASVAARVSSTVAVLMQFPHIGHTTSRPTVRRVALVPYPYFLDHRIDPGAVVVLRFRHAARKPIV